MGVSAKRLCIIALVLCSVALLTQLLPYFIVDYLCTMVYQKVSANSMVIWSDVGSSALGCYENNTCFVDLLV